MCCGVNGLCPLLVLAVELRLLQKIGSLQHRFQGIAEVMGQRAEVGNNISGLGDVLHGDAGFDSLRSPCRILLVVLSWKAALT